MSTSVKVSRRAFGGKAARQCAPARQNAGLHAAAQHTPLALAASTRPPRCTACTAFTVSCYEGDLAAPQQRFGIVAGRFNSLVTKLLLDGALEALRKAKVAEENIHVAWVPGSFELPVVAKSMAKSGAFDAVICIGAVVRGATTHYEEVCGAATSGCLDASSSTGIPVIFGVITTENMEQALDRAGGKVGNKGYEAALTAVEMATLMAALRSDGRAVAPWIGDVAEGASNKSSEKKAGKGRSAS